MPKIGFDIPPDMDEILDQIWEDHRRNARTKRLGEPAKSEIYRMIMQRGIEAYLQEKRERASR